ncbi:hypothetical protein [Beduini massiliensis]|uniref:hypothetical protein n=1 Tax=Beduini massiliensis TaxID=1585974 RepID=UPI00059A7B54|nr:hypothetical protein [Beduini massiliensis]
MIDLIKNEYNLDIIGMIKVNENVYKLKVADGFLALKFTESYSFAHNYYYIKTLRINCFVPVILNLQQSPLTRYQNQYFYLMPWYESDLVPMRELKLKFYFETLAWLHNHTFYNVKVSKQYYEKLCKDIYGIIQERANYYYQLLVYCEQSFDRSPWQWMLLMNYYRIENSLNCAYKYLEQFQSMVCSKEYVRVSLVYMNFKYQHIYLNYQKLISIDHMKIDMPIYDIFNMYQQTTDTLFDLDSLFQFYLNKVVLYNDERVLLAALLSITPIVELKGKNIDNVIQLSRLVYYMDSVCRLSSQLVNFEC